MEAELPYQSEDIAMPVTIKTNHQWRDLSYRSDMPASVLEGQFSHLSEDDAPDGFFCYRRFWYHTSDFMRVEHNADLAGWHGYASDSYFSGVLVKLSSDGERVLVGSYYS
jgi:hypothetical protein